MSEQERNYEMLGNIAQRSHLVRSACKALTLHENNKGALLESVKDDPILLALGDDLKSVLTMWNDSIAMYESKYNTPVRDDMLAASHQSLENLLGSSQANQILESAYTSNAVMVRNKYAGMIMPVTLAAATSDAATMIPSGTDKAEVFELIKVVTNNTGEMVAGDEIQANYNKQGGALHQRYALVEFSDTDFSLDLNTQIEPVSTQKFTKKVGVKIYSVDDATGVATLLGFTVEGIDAVQLTDEGTAIITTLTVIHTADSGTSIELELQTASPVGTHYEVSFDLDPQLSETAIVPVISHKMRSYELTPHEHIATATSSVQAYFAMLREFNITLTTFHIQQMVEFLAHQKDVRNLREMYFHTKARSVFDMGVGTSGFYKDDWERLRVHLLAVSSRISTLTKDVGMIGLYASKQAAEVIKGLGLSNFTPAPNYKQTDNIHYCGVLFGIFRVYEEPVVLKNWDTLCYGRGDTYSRAGYVQADAIPSISYVHATTNTLKNQESVWGTSYGDMHPNNGENYFEIVTFNPDSMPTSKGYTATSAGITFPAYDRNQFFIVAPEGGCEVAYGEAPLDADFIPLDEVKDFLDTSPPHTAIVVRAITDDVPIKVITYPHI